MRLFWGESLGDYAVLIAPTIRVGYAPHRIFAWCLFCLPHHLGNNAIQHIEVAKLDHHFALIFGADELARGEVTVKALRDGQGAQQSRPLAEAAQWAAHLQSHA